MDQVYTFNTNSHQFTTVLSHYKAAMKKNIDISDYLFMLSQL